MIGLWPVEIRDELRRALLDEGLRKIDLFTARHKLAVAEWPVVPYDPFFNANAPDDLTQAEGHRADRRRLKEVAGHGFSALDG